MSEVWKGQIVSGIVEGRLSTSTSSSPKSYVATCNTTLRPHLHQSWESQGRCSADLCGALHCDYILESKRTKTKCNPAAAARNRHLCESLADTCFPVSQGHSASRLHELFLRQFCDAHACSGGRKPFSRGGRKKSSILYLAFSILIVMLLPVFYLLVYFHQRGLKKGIQDLKRISKKGGKTKPS